MQYHGRFWLRNDFMFDNYSKQIRHTRRICNIFNRDSTKNPTTTRNIRQSSDTYSTDICFCLYDSVPHRSSGRTSVTKNNEFRVKCTGLFIYIYIYIMDRSQCLRFGRQGLENRVWDPTKIRQRSDTSLTKNTHEIKSKFLKLNV